METAEMRRSTLQRKDREELTMIATTLGRKPPSRARKGEIIDLILELATGGDGSESAVSDDDETETPSPDASASDEPGTDASDAEEAGEAGGGDSDDAVAETASDQDSTVSDDEATSDASPKARNADRERAPRNRKRGDKPDKKAVAEHDSTGSDDDQGSDDGGRGATVNKNDRSERGADNDRPSSDDDGSEQGNRRRRRRGRDRDNNKDSDEKWDGEPIPVAGHLELRSEGYGFLRVDGALPSKDDAYVPVKMVRQFGLRKGDHLVGTSRPANRNEKNPAMMEIASVNDAAPEATLERSEFDALTVIYPTEPIVLAGSQKPADPTGRAIDLLAPIGKGQRALLAAPPRTGATTVLQHVIRSLETNHKDLDVLVLLLDERPEDITEMLRWVERADVTAAGFDRPAEEQVTIAEMVIERAKRLVEAGRDVVVLVDGMTRLARAYAQESSGGRGVTVDATTIHPAKRFLGSARNLEGGGSLTMLATVSVGTDSENDATIYEELGRTANAEIRLDRAAAVRRVYPAIDVAASGTVHDEALRASKDVTAVAALRKELAGISDDPTTEASADLQALLEKISKG